MGILMLNDNNNIWSNTGDIEESIYIRDLNITINKILEQ